MAPPRREVRPNSKSDKPASTFPASGNPAPSLRLEGAIVGLAREIECLRHAFVGGQLDLEAIGPTWLYMPNLSVPSTVCLFVWESKQGSSRTREDVDEPANMRSPAAEVHQPGPTICALLRASYCGDYVRPLKKPGDEVAKSSLGGFVTSACP